MLERDVWSLENQVTELKRVNRQLSERVATIELRVQVIYHALVAHAGDYVAHPCSANDALDMLRELASPSPSGGEK